MTGVLTPTVIYGDPLSYSAPITEQTPRQGTPMVSGPASFARPLPAQVLRAASSQVYSPARCGNACFWDTSLQCTASAPRRKEKLRRVAFDARPVAAMVEGT